MKNDDTFSENEIPSTSVPERGVDSDDHALLPPHNAAPGSSSSTQLSRKEQRLTSRRHMRLILAALTVVMLVALAKGYGVFRVVSPPSRTASSAFQKTQCLFPLGGGFVAGQNVKCGLLTVPQDWSQPQGPTIRLAVAIFKASDPHPAPDPVLILGGGPAMATLETLGPTYNLGNLPSNRDLILFDQRGAGYSQPSLHCSDNEAPKACHDWLVKSGINLNAFTTLENAADVDALIKELGYRIYSRIINDTRKSLA